MTIDFYGNSNQTAYSEMCKNLSNELDLNGIINFYEQDRNIADRYREHNLFILPSSWEGYPNVLCEAMSCGLPILASNISDIPFIIEDKKNGFLFNPQSPKNIADTIIKYIKLKSSQKFEMALKSIEMALLLFSKDKFINKYL